MRRLLIIAPPRSGSTLLAERLNTHPDISFFGEVLNERRALWHPGTAPGTYAGRLTDPGAFLDRHVWSAATPVAGFKMLEHQFLLFHHLLPQYFAGLDDLRVIYLTRRNLLHQFLSIKLAEAMDFWFLFNEADRPTLPRVRLDPDELSLFLRHSRTCQDMIRPMLRGRPALDVVYEDILADPSGTDAALCRFAGVASARLSHQSVKLRIDPATHHIANTEEVRAALAGSPWEEDVKDLV